MQTPKINLLPYRDEQKKAAKIRYGSFVGASVAFGAIIIAGVHSFYAMQISNQNNRNDLLTQEIAKLDKQIDEIKKLREEIAAAVSRKGVVESLQANRSRAVMILNQLVQPPANVYYKSATQRGDALSLFGYAPSNASVSALIKQIETSNILYEPRLLESKSVKLDTTTVVEFSINAKIIDLAKVAAEKLRASNTAKPKQNSNATTTSPQPAQPAAVVIKAPETQQPAVPTKKE